VRDPQNVTVEIRDQGQGISQNGETMQSGPALPGVGIQGMRERVRQLGGNFEIQSAPGNTVVRANIPIRLGGAAGQVAQAIGGNLRPR
jgi:signal transduction histidine kinase